MSIIEDVREAVIAIPAGFVASNLARRWCVRASAAMGTSPLTVRIDLDTR